jgi:membrane-associated phospholipid phosphatase
MRTFFNSLFRGFLSNTITCFRGRNLIWHLVAILFTTIFVISGFDWWYWKEFRETTIQAFLLPGIVLGFFAPVFVPTVLYIVGFIQKNTKYMLTAGGIGQAAILGLFLSFFYKALTGRAHPESFRVTTSTLIDVSRQFQFGFLRGGVFWGWPSSHTTVAFSVATALICMYPKNRLVKVIALLYAFYVGLGVSMSIHWFSDFFAGAIFGTLVGVVVGKSFKVFIKA